jgi:hypothetical protein
MIVPWAVSDFGQSGTLTDLIDRALPASLSLVHGFSVASLASAISGETCRSTICLMSARTASLKPERNGG